MVWAGLCGQVFNNLLTASFQQVQKIRCDGRLIAPYDWAAILQDNLTAKEIQFLNQCCGVCLRAECVR